MDYAIIAIVWMCVGLFAVTAVITVLALLNVLTLGGSPSAHQYFLKALFKTLVVEVIAISLGAFAAGIYRNRENNIALRGTLVTTLEGLESRIRLLEKDVLQK